VCSWANIWPGGTESIKRSPYIVHPNSFDNWERTAVEMMAINGMDPDRYELVPQTSNALMADIYRRADVAVFPNRCEAGTNMVMTEVMASGIPVIASYATRQREVLAPSHAYCLDQGDTLEDGWFEPSVDSIQHAIETAYNRRDFLCDIGLAGSRFIERFTWAKTAEALISACQH
jgi:glycosyltransferase involved in cell wall biosynthesis